MSLKNKVAIVTAVDADGLLSSVAHCDRCYFLNLALMTFSCSSGFSL
jgi:hypothetical protein